MWLHWQKFHNRRGAPMMTDAAFSLTRRSALFAAFASLLQTGTLSAGEKHVITVHKDPRRCNRVRSVYISLVFR
jgi:hypothetical protein